MESIPGRNGGKLLPGGKPGNRGGRGAIASDVRKACRDGFAKAVPKIIEIATDKTDGATRAEMVRAFDTLGKYGMGALEAVALDKSEWLKIVCKVTAEHVESADAYDRWFAALMGELDALAS